MKAYLYTFVWICCISFYGNATNTFLQLFSKKLTSSEIEYIVHNHISLAYDYLIKYELDSAKQHLDSASLYQKELTDLVILGYFHYYHGIYYSLEQDESNAHQCYYRAIDFFEKTNNNTLIIAIYHNLAFSYIQKKDTDLLKNIVDKMSLISLPDKSISELIQTYRIYAFYYNCMYAKNKQHKVFLDSAIYYDKEVISLYEANKNLTLRDEEITYNYIHYISNSLKKETFDIDTLNIYIDKADNLMQKNDTAMIINRLWIDGEIYFLKKDYIYAQQIFTKQLTLMEIWSPRKELSIYLEVYDRLTEIAEIQSDYKIALYYQQKKIDCLAQIHDTQKYEIIRELETKYEVKQKEQAIHHLTESNNFRKKINNLYLFLILSGIAAFIFIIRWFRQKRKTAAAQLELTRVEKDNALLQIQLKEKELNETISEKCIALVDNYFKDEQIAGMDQELQQLREEQEQLNQRIRNYVIEHEKLKSQEVTFATESPIFTSLLKDIYDLINKRIEDHTQEKKEYIDRLVNVTDHFFTTLRENASGELSPLNIKYCLCFYIGMKTEHIAGCFSVEVATVRMTKHRLKTRLKMDKEMDIDTFLKLIAS